MRDSVIREHLADSKLAVAMFHLIAAAHDVNRWDLTDSVVDGLCDAARAFAAEEARALAEHGMSHE